MYQKFMLLSTRESKSSQCCRAFMIRSASIRVSVTITSTKSQKMIRVLKASRQPCSALDGVGTSVVVALSFMGGKTRS